MQHRLNRLEDRCTCGGVVVFYADGDKHGLRGDGCEVADEVFDVQETVARNMEQHWLGEEHLWALNQGAPPLEVWAAFQADVQAYRKEA